MQRPSHEKQSTSPFTVVSTTILPNAFSLQACGWEGDLNDAMGLACICTNDHIDTMSTCIDCMDKIFSGANVSVFLVTLERTS